MEPVEKFFDWITFLDFYFYILSLPQKFFARHKKSQKSIISLICEYWQKNKSSSEELSEFFGIGRNTVSRYLKKGAELKLCNNNPKEVRKNAMTKKLGKPVIIKKENKVVGKFGSCAELERQSLMLYGIKLFAAQISKCALDGKAYKGYSFQYVS